MKKFLLILALIVVGISSVFANEERNVVNADLKSVTVYTSGAEMIHTASATLQQGNNEIVIENIANNININSIQIKAPNAVAIMSVEFSNNYIGTDFKSIRIKTLEDSVEKVQKEVDKLAIQLESHTGTLNILNKNQIAYGSQVGMNIEVLNKLLENYKVKSLELQTEIYQLTQKKTKLSTLISKINSQIKEEKNKNVGSRGRLTVQLTAATEGKFDFTISYIAYQANWSPYYDIKATDTKSPLKLFYKAKISQTTGIDWKKIKLSLSNTIPSESGNAPSLNTWFLSFVNPIRPMYSMAYSSRQAKSIVKSEDMDKNLNEVMVGSGSPGAASSIQQRSEAPLYIVDGQETPNAMENISPKAIKSMNVLKGSAATDAYGDRAINGVVVITLKHDLEDYVTTSDKALDLTYDIDLPYDVPTNGKAQSATLKSVDVTPNYQYFTIPKVDNAAYLLANITDWGKLNLQAGEANIIVEGTYVGKTYINPNQTTDTLSITLGRDKRITVKRDKVVDYSSVKFLGSNKLQKFSYEIALKNNKKESITLNVKDQYPISTNKDIDVELIDAAGAEVNKDLGLLDWKINLSAGESKKVRFTYSIKYPKDKIVNLQ